jgi:predicted AAA+ superfamily ATPase
LRSRANLRKKPKVNFIDPCLGVNLINATYEKLSKDFETLGFYFESLVIRDLKTYAETLGYDIFFYSDDENLEIDCIIENKDGY